MNLFKYSLREFRSGSVVHGNDNHSAHSRAPKGCEPFSGVCPPEHDAVALCYPNVVEKRGNALRLAEELTVRPANYAVPAREYTSYVTPMT